MDLTQYREQPVSVSSEAAYDRLTRYGFVQQYVRGKIVADIGWEQIGYGSRLLAKTAKSVEGLTNSPKAVSLASAAYSAPNVSFRKVELPELPYSVGYFDAVVAFGVVENLENPEDLVREAKRVLKKDGVLVISAIDKQSYTTDRDRTGIDGRREMYVPEFRELLERHFGHVHIYRQGAVAGGFVFPASEKVTGTLIQSARLSSTSADLGVEPPTTRFVIAVCSDIEAPGQEEQPYLLLDRDRRIFDECEDRTEDVELMRDEIQRMQETEVQAFRDAHGWHVSVAVELNRYLLNRYLIRLLGIMRSTLRRSFGLYRRLQARYRRSG
jgi:SAM-dependent methyltransferase